MAPTDRQIVVYRVSSLVEVQRSHHFFIIHAKHSWGRSASMNATIALFSLSHSLSFDPSHIIVVLPCDDFNCLFCVNMLLFCKLGCIQNHISFIGFYVTFEFRAKSAPKTWISLMYEFWRQKLRTSLCLNFRTKSLELVDVWIFAPKTRNLLIFEFSRSNP